MRSEATLISHCGQLDQCHVSYTSETGGSGRTFLTIKALLRPFYGFAGSFSFVTELLPDVTY